jgi:predicted esterase YcpF (UPF0227 family)
MATLLYLHGFNSGPGSKKAMQTGYWFKQNAPHINFVCPKISPYAKEACIALERLVCESCDPISVVGSSMGGFLGTHLIEKYCIKGALVNPAVNPELGLSEHLGENTSYLTNDKWIFKRSHIDEYQEITYQSIKQHQNYLILLETGDKILNYKHAVQFYDKASIIIEEGGDHRFVSYSKHLPTIYNFLFSNSQSKSF